MMPDCLPRAVERRVGSATDVAEILAQQAERLLAVLDSQLDAVKQPSANSRATA